MQYSTRSLGARHWRLPLAAALIALLSACASPYGTRGLTGGYSSSKVQDNMYRVSYSGNGYTTEEMVVVYWLYHSAELTLKNGYQYYTLVVPEAKTSSLPALPALEALPTERVTMQGRTEPDGEPQIVQMKGGGGGGGRYIYIPSYGGGGGSRKFYKDGTIAMYRTREEAPMEHRQALHAPTVIERFKSYVESAGKNSAPPRRDVIAEAAWWPSKPPPEIDQSMLEQ